MENHSDDNVVSAEPVLKETSPWFIFQKFKNKRWMANAFQLVLTFVPKFILPSVLGLVAIGVWLAAAFIVSTRMSQFNEVSEVLVTLTSALLALLTSAATYIWSLTLWLTRLTAVSAATLSLPEESWNEKIDAASLKTAVSESMKIVAQRKGFMTRYYLLVTLYMLAPIVCMSVCGAVVVGSKFVAMPGFTMPKWFEYSALGGFIASGVFVFVMSMISLVVSSNCKMQVQKSVYKTIGLSVNLFLPCLVLSLLDLILLTITTEPFTPFFMTSSATLSMQTIILMVLNLVWQSIVSIFVVPFVVIPFAELLRGRFE